MSACFILPDAEEDRQIVEDIVSDPDAAPDLSSDRDGNVVRLDLSFAGRRTGLPNLRIDGVVIAHFRAGGSDWQTRINTAQRKVAGL